MIIMWIGAWSQYKQDTQQVLLTLTDEAVEARVTKMFKWCQTIHSYIKKANAAFPNKQ